MPTSAPAQRKLPCAGLGQQQQQGYGGTLSLSAAAAQFATNEVTRSATLVSGYSMCSSYDDGASNATRDAKKLRKRWVSKLRGFEVVRWGRRPRDSCIEFTLISNPKSGYAVAALLPKDCNWRDDDNRPLSKGIGVLMIPSHFRDVGTTMLARISYSLGKVQWYSGSEVCDAAFIASHSIARGSAPLVPAFSIFGQDVKVEIADVTASAGAPPAAPSRPPPAVPEGVPTAHTPAAPSAPTAPAAAAADSPAAPQLHKEVSSYGDSILSTTQSLLRIMGAEGADACTSQVDGCSFASASTSVSTASSSSTSSDSAISPPRASRLPAGRAPAASGTIVGGAGPAGNIPLLPLHAAPLEIEAEGEDNENNAFSEEEQQQQHQHHAETEYAEKNDDAQEETLQEGDSAKGKGEGCTPLASPAAHPAVPCSSSSSSSPRPSPRLLPAASTAAAIPPAASSPKRHAAPNPERRDRLKEAAETSDLVGCALEEGIRLQEEEAERQRLARESSARQSVICGGGARQSLAPPAELIRAQTLIAEADGERDAALRQVATLSDALAREKSRRLESLREASNKDIMLADLKAKLAMVERVGVGSAPSSSSSSAGGGPLAGKAGSAADLLRLRRADSASRKLLEAEQRIRALQKAVSEQQQQQQAAAAAAADTEALLLRAETAEALCAELRNRAELAESTTSELQQRIESLEVAQQQGDGGGGGGGGGDDAAETCGSSAGGDVEGGGGGADECVEDEVVVELRQQLAEACRRAEAAEAEGRQVGDELALREALKKSTDTINVLRQQLLKQKAELAQRSAAAAAAAAEPRCDELSRALQAEVQTLRDSSFEMEHRARREATLRAEAQAELERRSAEAAALEARMRRGEGRIAALAASVAELTAERNNLLQQPCARCAGSPSPGGGGGGRGVSRLSEPCRGMSSGAASSGGSSPAMPVRELRFSCESDMASPAAGSPSALLQHRVQRVAVQEGVVEEEEGASLPSACQADLSPRSGSASPGGRGEEAVEEEVDAVSRGLCMLPM